jgi:TRAP transporter TAXI family solute receptor
MRKRFVSIAVVLLLLMYLVVGCTSNTASKGIYISIATGGTAGTYYPLGGALAKIFNDNIDGVNANVQSTGASFEGKEKVTNLRGMAMIYPELVQIIATEESGIKTVEDLKGKKVAIGAPGSGVEANARQVLAVHGMTYDDLGKADYLSFNEAADQLKNKQIDAAFLTAGIPTSAVTEVGQTSKIAVVPIASDKISKLSEAYPFYTEVVIPADTYSGQSQDITTAAVMAMLVVSDKLEDDLVYNLTKEMFEKRQVIIDTHSRGNDLKLETALKGMPIELHPGAKRYYDEKGIK